MRCTKVRENLERFLDGAVSTRRTLEIKEHLATCSSCSTVYAELEAMKSLLRESTLPPMPEAIAANIMTVARNSFFSRHLHGSKR